MSGCVGGTNNNVGGNYNNVGGINNNIGTILVLFILLVIIARSCHFFG
ncbi:competence transcription factor ComK [Paenibacillus castaneae]|nr:hypothetical protein [Paenibacillus castaneae]NIK78774.1 competence transcription factor ComK [Paenibacillus castaneae]